MKNKYSLVLLVMLLFVTVSSLKAQDDIGLFISTSGELPTIDLNGSNTISQQYNFGFGYAFPKNIELYLNIGSGVLADNSEISGFAYNTTSLGVGVNYLYPITTDYKLGVELLGAFGEPNTTGTNYNFVLYQGGIKVQSSNLIFCTLGVRYRSFSSYDINSTELFYGIGMRLGVKKKQ
ncbi:MAG: hypothetical protein PF436_05085 [Prolixibacteraceae bacterium]|jgi:hypothetical protein|nr:hypothetical protein [Prolixibacteraceae bacterium]